MSLASLPHGRPVIFIALLSPTYDRTGERADEDVDEKGSHEMRMMRRRKMG